MCVAISISAKHVTGNTDAISAFATRRLGQRRAKQRCDHGNVEDRRGESHGDDEPQGAGSERVGDSHVDHAGEEPHRARGDQDAPRAHDVRRVLVARDPLLHGP
jgi:hypothetical protein